MSLVNKSLIQRQPDGRFAMHELLRQYAAEKLTNDLDEFEDARDRHSSYYCRLLAEQLPKVKGAKQRESLTAVDADIENVRAAWNWAVIDGQLDRQMQAVETLGLYYWWRRRGEEGRIAFEAAATALDADGSDDEAALMAMFLAWQALFPTTTERPETLVSLAERSLQFAQRAASTSAAAVTVRAFAWYARGETAVWTLQSQAAEDFLGSDGLECRSGIGCLEGGGAVHGVAPLVWFRPVSIFTLSLAVQSLPIVSPSVSHRVSNAFSLLCAARFGHRPRPEGGTVL